MPLTAAGVAPQDESERSPREAEAAPADDGARDLPADVLLFEAWRVLAKSAQKSAELAHSLANTRQCIDQLRGQLRAMGQSAGGEPLN